MTKEARLIPRLSASLRFRVLTLLPPACEVISEDDHGRRLILPSDKYSHRFANEPMNIFNGEVSFLHRFKACQHKSQLFEICNFQLRYQVVNHFHIGM